MLKKYRTKKIIESSINSVFTEEHAVVCRKMIELFLIKYGTCDSFFELTMLLDLKNKFLEEFNFCNK